jgi:SfnB family sulfur acquisition oxidoreductase
MNEVVRLAAKLRAVAPYIKTEDEAIGAARLLAGEISIGSSARDQQRILPYHEMEQVAKSGILGITVPADYGGADISNPYLAEVIAILAEADSSIGQIPQNHFFILDVLRLVGSEEQKRYFFTRALAGDHFANALAERHSGAAGAIDTRLVPDGPGHRITGQKYYSTGALFADWIAVFARDPRDRIVMAVLSRDTDGLTITDDWAGFGQRTTASGTIAIDNVYVPADSVVEYQKALDAPAPLGSLAQLLHAAVDLGIARAAFADMIDFVKTKSRGNLNLGLETASDDPLTMARAGAIAVKIDAAAAMIERAGRKVDIAQVSPSSEAARDASLAAAAAKILTTEAALEATNGLFELAGTSATDESLNLDRHWRNARTHTVHDPVRWKHHAIGDYHINGRLPRPNGQF